MRKICNKIGKIFGIMGIFLLLIWTKVLAKIPMNIIAEDMDPSVYGVSRPERVIFKVFDLGKILLIPFILLLGLFIYYRAKDKEKYAKKSIIIKRSLIIISIILIIIGGLYVNYIISNM